MKIHNNFFTPPHLIFTLLLALSVLAGCQVESNDEPIKKTFTITFNANGGEGEMDSQTADEGAEITLTANAFTRTGYDFTGWNSAEDGSGASYGAGEKITLTENLTLYAQWSEVVKVFYTVKFDANGGEGEMKEVTAESGSEVTVATNAFTREGWTFGGWNTKSDGTGSPYNDKAKITLTADITLYAQWAAGTGTAYKVEHWQQDVADSGYTLAKTEPMTGTTGAETAAKAEETAGFTAKEFAQEKIAADGSTVVKIWYDRKTITLTFDADNGEDKTTLSGKFGAEVKTDAPSKNGYDFIGWNPELPATFPAEDAEFKAQWKAATYKISYTLNDGTNAEANPASYTVETEKVTFASPTRRYYAFRGWFTDSAFTDSSKITGWSAGERTGDITLYAKWEMTLESLGLAAGKIVLTGDIPEETLRAVAATIIANPDKNITLDLGGTTITEIPDELFIKLDESCENLAGIILPEGLKSIGAHAFAACSGLTEVEIPSGTTSIGDYAFYNTGIKSAKIPASIEAVGVDAFSCDRDFYNETQQRIETVEYGGTLAQWQNLYAGTDEDRDNYRLQHAVVTTSDGGICCPEDKFEEVLETFGAGSEAHIAVRGSYRNVDVDYVTIASAMKSNSDVKVHLDLSKSRISTGSEKFKDCTNLVGIELSTLDTKIDAKDFSGCTGLKSITIPANITEIEGYAFGNCAGLEEVTFLGNISDASLAFEGCTNLSKVNFPEGLTRIPDGICSYLTALTSIEIPAGVTEIEDGAFKGSGLESVEIPAGVTRLGYIAFGGNEKLKSVTINAVDIVLAHPFEGCTALKDVYYAGTMAEWEALKNTESLSENDKLQVKWAFENAPLTTATIHCSDGAIASVSATASEAATVISGFTEAGTYTVTVTGGITGSDLAAIKNAMSSNPEAKIILDLSGTTGLTEIPERAFCFCSSLAGIKIPEGITSIGKLAFSQCYSLATLELPSTLTSIGISAFEGCVSLTKVKIPEGITSISEAVFSGCTELVSVELPSSLSSIDMGAFNYCTSLKSIKIPEGVTSIGDMAFYRCGITTMELPASLTSIGDEAFYYNSVITAVINFGGTKAQWNAITVGANNRLLNKNGIIIHCSDGDITP